MSYLNKPARQCTGKYHVEEKPLPASLPPLRLRHWIYAHQLISTNSRIMRFLKRIRVDANGCWIWQGSRHNLGYGLYGRTADRKKSLSAHRFSYEYFVGPIPDGLEVHHVCAMRPCVNPLHLQAVTHAENLAATRTSHCKRGHARTPENIIEIVTVKRTCRLCVNHRQRQATYEP